MTAGVPGPFEIAFHGTVRDNESVNSSCELYLLRHAEAEEIGSRGVARDEDRMLTEKGVRQARAAGICLSRLGVKPGVVLASPLRRARETASLVIDELGLKDPPVAAEELIPHAAPEPLWRLVRTHAGQGPILLVGHLPSLAVFAGWLIESGGEVLHFRKASLARIDVTIQALRPEAMLEWLLPVSVVKAISQDR